MAQARITKYTAEMILDQAKAHGDYHALNTDAVESILAFAKEFKYRKPKNANGSTGRYFHAYLTRVANREECNH